MLNYIFEIVCPGQQTILHVVGKELTIQYIRFLLHRNLRSLTFAAVKYIKLTATCNGRWFLLHVRATESSEESAQNVSSESLLLSIKHKYITY